MATAAPEARFLTSEDSSLRDSQLNKSLTSIEWLNELEPTSLLTSQLTSSRANPCKRPAASDANAEPAKKRKSTESTGTTPPHLQKPPFSYATLIAFAINSGPDKRMTLSQIYEWLETNFPFFKTAKSAWKNSIRHNLSLRNTFVRERRLPHDLGKGSYWMIRPGEEEKVLQTTFRELRQQQSYRQIQLHPQLQAKGTTKFTPILPRMPVIPLQLDYGNSFTSMINQHLLQQQQQQQQQMYLNVPLSLDARPRERLIMPNGSTTPVHHPHPSEHTRDELIMHECKVVGEGGEGLVNDHTYCSMLFQYKSEHIDNDMFEHPDPYFGDFISDINRRDSSPFNRSTPTKQISPNFFSPRVSPDDDVIKSEFGDINASFTFTSNGLISTPWKYDFVMTSYPNTPIRTGLTPTRGIDYEDYGSLKMLGLSGLTPFKSTEIENDSLNVSGLERLLDM